MIFDFSTCYVFSLFVQFEVVLGICFIFELGYIGLGGVSDSTDTFMVFACP